MASTKKITPVAKPSKPKGSMALLLEIIEDASKNIPDSEIAKLPKDGAAQHDHYLYGSKKRR